MPVAISSLPAMTVTPTANDLLALVEDLDATTKKLKLSELLAYLILQTNSWAEVQTFLKPVEVPFGSATDSLRFCHDSGNNACTGDRNIAIGPFVLNAVTSGQANIGVGYGSLQHCTTGDGNFCLGAFSGTSLTTGASNVAVGNNAFRSGTSGSNNIAIGIAAMYGNNGGANTCVGNQAMTNNTGDENCAFGIAALYGSGNAFGNSAFGTAAAFSISTGSGNVVVGYHAGRGISPGGAALTTGSSNVLIGRYADTSAASTVEAVALGQNAVASSNSFDLGPYLTQQVFHTYSSTSVNVPTFGLVLRVVNNTHASRKYGFILNAFDTAARECMRGEADGINSRLGFFGVVAVVQPTTSGTGTSGFTPNASANPLFAESTFDGGIGGTAYTVSDIVLALKQLGLLAA